MAKNYIDNLREESMKGMAEKLTQGWLPATPPPGYMTVGQNGKKIHVPDPKTAPLMKRVFEFYDQHNQSILSTAQEMKRLGIVTSKGRPYYKSQVQRILSNPFYIGINHFSGKDYPGLQEPIISKELFARVQQKMHRKTPLRYRKHNPVLKNMITCDNCKGLVTWQLQKGHYYGTCQRASAVCKGRKLLREDALETEIARMLKELVSPSPKVIDWLAEAMQVRHKDTIISDKRLAESVTAQIQRVERMDSNLYDDKLAGEITAEKYEQKHTELESEKASLEQQLVNIDTSAGLRLEKRLTLLELSQKAADIYSTCSPEQKRTIITKLFEKLTYSEGIVSVTYTNFSRAIAQNVKLTHQIIGGAK